MEARHTGMVVYRASRLEALLQPLECLLEKFPPAHWLTPHSILAAHPGIKRWLQLALAHRRGPKGIVANLEVSLPSTWIDACVRAELGVSAIALAPYQREALRWRIHELLPQIDDRQITHFLEQDDGRRRFQLADRLAAIFSRYMVYRPDWLDAWQSGRDDLPTRNVLAPLWRRLRAEIGEPHRGERIAALTELRRRAPVGDLAEPLHVFGISHLPPTELALLGAESRHRLVVLYVPDPCAVFWAGLGNDRAQLAQWARRAQEAEGEREFLALGHPLLAAWGRMGQHFGLRLHEGSGDVVLENRHGEDERWKPESESLLHRLQQSIREMSDEPLAALAPDSKKAQSDESLRVHGCHTRVRELEVLHDAICAAFEADPTMTPSDILVMSPSIAEYAALVPAVFADKGHRATALSYHFADVPRRRTHECFDAWLALVAIPTSRVAVSQIIDLLQVPTIRRAFGIDVAALARLCAWLGEARVAWGSDAATRRHFVGHAFAEHSFGWGIDRMLTGYVFGDSVAEQAAQQVGVWPVSGVSGVEVEALGALDRLLVVIAEWGAFAAGTHGLSDWIRQLDRLLRSAFRADPEDPAEQAALSDLFGLVENLRTGTSPSMDPRIGFAALRELIETALDAVPERQPYLIGGITFSGMVPQRSIPFRMIAVLGMNDGDFPRRENEGGIDLMSRHRRLGDRDVRSDDRYLFLETVMAARSRLHISFHSEGVRDGKPRNPAAPLAELMAYLDGGAAQADPKAKAPRPWFIQHPLQPFDARYFDGSDARLFTYDERFARMRADGRSSTSRFMPLTETETNGASSFDQPKADSIVVPLKQLRGYLKRPAEHLLKQQLKLRFDLFESDALSDDEPLAPSFEAFDRVPQELLDDALAAHCRELPEVPPDRLRLRGRMPAGALGEQAYATVREQAQLALDQVHADQELREAWARPVSIDIGQRIGPFEVSGSVQLRETGSNGWLLVTFLPRADPTLSLRDRLSIFLDWALLRLKCPDRTLRVVVLTAPGKTRNPKRFDDLLNGPGLACAPDELQRRMLYLLMLWQRAQKETVWYLPNLTQAVAEARPERERKAGKNALSSEGSRQQPSSPYETLFTRDVDLFAGADWENLRSVAKGLQACVDFEADGEGGRDA